MKRSLSKQMIFQIERCINRGNSAVVKVEHGDMVILEEKRTLFYRDEKQRKEDNPTGLTVK